MDHPDRKQAALAAFMEILRQQVPHLGRPKGVQVEFIGDRNFNRFVILIAGYHPTSIVPSKPAGKPRRSQPTP